MVCTDRHGQSVVWHVKHSWYILNQYSHIDEKKHSSDNFGDMGIRMAVLSVKKNNMTD